jgi:hypothetical protein
MNVSAKSDRTTAARSHGAERTLHPGVTAQNAPHRIGTRFLRETPDARILLRKRPGGAGSPTSFRAALVSFSR